MARSQLALALVFTLQLGAEPAAAIAARWQPRLGLEAWRIEISDWPDVRMWRPGHLGHAEPDVRTHRARIRVRAGQAAERKQRTVVHELLHLMSTEAGIEAAAQLLPAAAIAEMHVPYSGSDVGEALRLRLGGIDREAQLEELARLLVEFRSHLNVDAVVDHR